jgi:Tol biopolymer transport system component
MRDGKHFLSHTVFSPNSRRFVFLHRWIHDDVTKRWSRMVSSDLEGKEIRVYPTAGMASHIGWRDANHVIAYCRVPDAGDQYVVFDDREPSNFEVVGEGQFRSDGHPSFESSGRWMVTDSYPDRRRRQNLMLFDTERERRYDLAHLPSARRYQTPQPDMHWACDLHPRWSRDGSRICFDSVHTGTRALCTIDLGSNLIDSEPRYL